MREPQSSAVAVEVRAQPEVIKLAEHSGGDQVTRGLYIKIETPHLYVELTPDDPAALAAEIEAALPFLRGEETNSDAA